MTPEEMDQRWDDYERWHWAQVGTKDVDPVYPWLAEVAKELDLDYAERGWLVMCHVVWYHPGSTLAGYSLLREGHQAIPDTYEEAEKLGLLTLPTGTERRAHRSKTSLWKHLVGLRDLLPKHGIIGYVGGMAGWAVPWPELNERIAQLPGNGRWAAYKTGEMLAEVAGLKTRITDAGHAFSSGPRKGLADLYGGDVEGNKPEAVAELDRRTVEVATFLGTSEIGQVETSLCDFHSALGGRYYVGHDIDGMQTDLSNPRSVAYTDGDLLELAWLAREAVFDHALLGELQGWTGVRKELKTAYRDRRELVGIQKETP